MSSLGSNDMRMSWLPPLLPLQTSFWPKTQNGLDVLAPEGYGEVIGGGQREDDLDLLQGRLRAHGLSEEAFAWYLDLRRYGSVPHGGFGLGIERTVCWIAGIEHVRECIPFPRMLYRIYP